MISTYYIHIVELEDSLKIVLNIKAIKGNSVIFETTFAGFSFWYPYWITLLLFYLKYTSFFLTTIFKLILWELFKLQQFNLVTDSSHLIRDHLYFITLTTSDVTTASFKYVLLLFHILEALTEFEQFFWFIHVNWKN